MRASPGDAEQGFKQGFGLVPKPNLKPQNALTVFSHDRSFGLGPSSKARVRVRWFLEQAMTLVSSSSWSPKNTKPQPSPTLSTQETQLRPSPPRRVTLAAQSPMTCERPRRPPPKNPDCPALQTRYCTVLYGFIMSNQRSPHPLWQKMGLGGPPPGSHGQARWLLVLGGNLGWLLNNNNQGFASKPRPSLSVQTPPLRKQRRKKWKPLGDVEFTGVSAMELTLPQPRW
ncbi:hypothetical protein FLAG1_08695 [Fusarium langsethiae]|uniref:Uncharacterized protein n=1 Tax=Fusarium langsethiae TaxID=179993 RepID=A0A0M9ES09_FUSLA|nr:hypothetical protein FLAG1_08695 [Fusarium langsethiae]GKU06173.1 unnamed protein product [Fusarium langsethiae]GKU21590.1 unnamed protein product [Fusarium langsethiae]